MRKYSIGLDFGTNSCRALMVDTADGSESATAVFNYPSGQAGIITDPANPNLARQNPRDYIDGFLSTVRKLMEDAQNSISGFSVRQIIGIGVDTTGSTPIPVDADGVPLALKAEFRDRPAAQAWLWKDHTAWEEADIITEAARSAGAPYLSKCGGAYSCEWFWSKILHCERTAPDVFAAAYSWVELCDFIPAYITGNLSPLEMARSTCAAGHKAMFHKSWGGLPSEDFLRRISPGLAALRSRLYTETKPSDRIAGFLSAEIAERVGLPGGIPVAVGALDAHQGAVGAGVKPGSLVKVIGTSSCDILVAPGENCPADIPGICGMVPDSVIPGMIGLEAGQFAVGDLFLWFAERLCPPEFRHSDPGATITALYEAAAAYPPGAAGLIALDWNNGNRSILADPLLGGALVGQTLHTSAPEVFRALVEATAFGTATINRHFIEHGVKVEEIIACGGIAEKSPFMMQIYADICDMPIKLSRSSQTSALGSAIFGAVVGGAYQDAASAGRHMTGLRNQVYTPNPAAVEVYSRLYRIYRDLHDAFGGAGAAPTNLGAVMKELIAIRDRARRVR